MTFVMPEDEYRHLRFGFRRRDLKFYAEHTAPFAFCLFSAVTPVYLPIILFLPEMTGMLIGMLPVSAVVLVFVIRAMKDMAKLKALEKDERDRAMREHEEQERKKHWKY